MWAQAKRVQSYWVTLMAAFLAFSLAACHKAQPADAVCSYETLPAKIEIAPGQGGIETVASTDAYFSVRDRDGKQITSTRVNAIAGLPEGDYDVILNGSVHRTSAQPKMLTKCSSGMVLVNGKSDEYYSVLDVANRQ